jgi:hypothetical protein
VKLFTKINLYKLLLSISSFLLRIVYNLQNLEISLKEKSVYINFLYSSLLKLNRPVQVYIDKIYFENLVKPHITRIDKYGLKNLIKSI